MSLKIPFIIPLRLFTPLIPLQGQEVQNAGAFYNQAVEHFNARRYAEAVAALL